LRENSLLEFLNLLFRIEPSFLLSTKFLFQKRKKPLKTENPNLISIYFSHLTVSIKKSPYPNIPYSKKQAQKRVEKVKNKS